MTATDTVNEAFLRRITLDPDVRSGKPCVRNTRVTVYDVLGWLAAGWTEREILDEFPALEKDDLRAVYVWASHELTAEASGL